MTRNIGSLDRMIRLVVGVVLLALVFVGPQTPWGSLGLVFIITGPEPHSGAPRGPEGLPLAGVSGRLILLNS